MPANTSIIPIKAIRTGDQTTGDVTALGEFESGDKIDSSYFNLSFNDASLSGNTTFDTTTMFVDGTNNRVGIGTTTPSEKLDVSGNIAVSGTVDGRDVAADGTKLDGIEASADVTDATNVTAAGALMDSELTSEASVKALNQGVATTDSPSFAGLTVDTDTLYVDSTNNRVGIGTTSPTEPLDVVGTIGSNVSSTGDFNFKATSTGGGQYRIYPDDATTANPTWFHQTNSSEDQAFVIGGVERVRINSSGNVGIGATSPNYKLDVSGGALGGTSGNTVDLLKLYSTVSNGSHLNFQTVRTSTGSNWNSAGTRIQQVIDAVAQGYIQFNGDGNDYGISFGKGSTEHMRIDTDGDVGIGGAAPSGYRLEVTQNTAADLVTRTYNADTTSTSDTIHQYRVNNDAASNYIQFGDATSASAGSLRYNHSADSWTWNIGGASKFLMESDGDFHADGDVIAYSTSVSDERLKENIEIISNAVDKVSRIKGVTFTRKGGNESAGIIAQDILNILPQAVKEKSLPLQTGTDDKYYVVEYDAVTGLLVQAVKELTERVQELEKNHYK